MNNLFKEAIEFVAESPSSKSGLTQLFAFNSGKDVLNHLGDYGCWIHPEKKIGLEIIHPPKMTATHGATMRQYVKENLPVEFEKFDDDYSTSQFYRWGYENGWVRVIRYNQVKPSVIGLEAPHENLSSALQVMISAIISKYQFIYVDENNAGKYTSQQYDLQSEKDIKKLKFLYRLSIR